MRREEKIQLASQTHFDLIILGGGIIGAGIARDAAMRGLKAALLEMHDFSSGTTAGSTRLIHGGLRYLELLDFRLVRLDLREREILLRIAPHLVRPLEFYLPYYHQSWLYRSKLKAGMMLYDLLSYDKNLPPHQILSAREVSTREPELSPRGLQGAAVYFDAQVNLPERLCLENLIDAEKHGTQIFNYAEALDLLQADRRVVGVRAKSSLPGESMEFELRGHLVINASGPWLDRLMKKFSPSTPERMRTTKGIHLAFPPLNRHAMALFSAVDRRLVFAIPWLGYSWIGTTDTDFAGDASGARATREDAEYLVRSLQPYLPRLESSPIYFANAGVRALVREKGSESSVSRMHRIVDEEENGLPGLISVLGGKITGYRAIAEEVTDLAGKKLRIKNACQTARQPLPGAAAFTSGSLSADSISAETGAHWQSLYGTRTGLLEELIRENEDLRQPLHPAYPDLAAQVILAIREEACQRVSDFLLRRTRLGFTPDLGIQAVPAIAEWMGRELGWSEARRSAEIEACHEELSRGRL